jgi:hypothetical protein
MFEIEYDVIGYICGSPNPRIERPRLPNTINALAR